MNLSTASDLDAITEDIRARFVSKNVARERALPLCREAIRHSANAIRAVHRGEFETAKELVPKPVLRPAGQATRIGAIYFGSTSPAMSEALDLLDGQGLHVDALRVRAFPFSDEVIAFIAGHDRVFVVEQNRDAQLKMLLVNECAVDPAKLLPVLHYDGTPITARFIVNEISTKLGMFNVAPLRKVVS